MSGTYISVPLAGSHLASFQNELLAVSPNGSVASYSIGSKSWIAKGSLSPVAYAQNPIVANTAFQQNPSADTLGGITVVAWEDSRGGVRFSVFDEQTRLAIINDQLLDSNGTNPHVCAGGNYLVILWANSGDLFTVGLQPQNPGVAVGPNPIASNAATATGTPFSPGLAVDLITNVSDSTSLLFAYTNSDGYAEIGYIYSNAGLGTGPVLGQTINGYVDPVATTINADQSIALVQAFSPGLQLAFLLAADSTTGLQCASVPASLVVTNTQTVDASDYIVNCGGVVSGAHPALATIVYETYAAETYNHFVSSATISTTLAPSTPVVLTRSLGMASQPFLGNDGNVYAQLVYEDPLQSTIFLYSVAAGWANVQTGVAEDGAAPGTLIGQGYAGTAGGLFSEGSTPRVFTAAAGVLSLALESRVVVDQAFQSSITGEPFTSIYPTGIDRLDMEWGATYYSTQAGLNTLFTGGQVGVYDGVSVVENQFALFPVVPFANFTVATSGGHMTAEPGGSQYTFAFVYFWRDQQRQAWYSAPSPAVTVTIPNSGGSPTTANKVTVTVPTLRVTNKSSVAPIPRQDIVIQCYRSTLADPGVLQLVGTGDYQDPVTAPVMNDTTADTVTFELEADDDTIAANQILYTNPTGQGVLPNLPMPPFGILAAGKGRVFGAEVPTDPFGLYYSQAWVQGQPVGFNPELVLPIPQSDGPITGVGVTDTNVLVFKENSVYSFAGDGPDSTGNNNQFTDVNLVTGDVGCVQQASIVIGSNEATFFLSAKGIYQCDRNLNMSYIGAPVERLVNPLGQPQVVITGATLITGTNQVRFTTNAGFALVYDSYFQQWSTFSLQPNGLNAVSAVNWAAGGAFSATESVAPTTVYTWMDAEGTVHFETPGQYMDGLVAITQTEKTSPLHFDGLQGYQRAQWLYFLMEYWGPHQLKLQLFYDNEPFSWQTILIDPQQWLQGSGYGTGGFGAGNFGGVVTPLYQFRVPISRQQCSTLQIQINDVLQGNSATYTVNQVTLIYQEAGGINPLSRGGRLRTISNGR